MLIIGHRGAAGLAPENTIESLQAGVDAGADMLEFDVRLTSDNHAILCHDPKLHGHTIRSVTLDELKQSGPVTLLETVLDRFFGEVFLNLELKPVNDIKAVYKLIASRIHEPSDWDNILVTSFHMRDLRKLRKLSKDINLGLLHSINPFAFVTYQRVLNLSAVGWHRLHINNLAIEIAKKAGIFTYVYTVNRPRTAERLKQKGIDGVVTDFPDRLAAEA